MRKIFLPVFLVLLMLFAFTACDDDSDGSSSESLASMELVDKLLAVVDEADEYIEDNCAQVTESNITIFFIDTDEDEEVDDDETVIMKQGNGYYSYSYTSEDKLSAVSGTWSWVNGSYTSYDGYELRSEERYIDLGVTLSGTYYTLYLEYTRDRYNYDDGSKGYEYKSASVVLDGNEIEGALDYIKKNW